MNADPLAAVRPALREALAGRPNHCVTLEVTGDAKRWLQCVDDTLNFAYPSADEPDRRLALLPWSSALGLKVVSWEAGKFCTCTVAEPIDFEMLAGFVDAVFVQLLGCREGVYRLDVGFFET